MAFEEDCSVFTVFFLQEICAIYYALFVGKKQLLRFTRQAELTFIDVCFWVGQF